jgi:hypothetical protein
LRMKRTRLVALIRLVRMATPRMARHTAAACRTIDRQQQMQIQSGSLQAPSASAPACMVTSGEITVTVTEGGRGRR